MEGSISVIFEIDVKIGGVPVVVKTMEDWNRVDAMARNYFQQNGMYTSSERSCNLSPCEIPDTNHRFTWTERAWAKLKRPATARELYHEAIALGFSNPGAIHPKEAFIKAVRDNPRMVEAGRAKGAVLYVVKGEWSPAETADDLPPTQDSEYIEKRTQEEG